MQIIESKIQPSYWLVQNLGSQKVNKPIKSTLVYQLQADIVGSAPHQGNKESVAIGKVVIF